MSDALQDRVRRICSQIFGIAAETIDEDTSPDTVLNWDSLKHMNLVLALEEEFGVQFTDTQTVEMMNVGLILSALRECGIKD